MLVAKSEADSELSVLLCDDSTIAELNERFRSKKGPTDVLAFSMREGDGAEMAEDVLGDVVISLDTARRQASERDRPIVAEVAFLLAHGLLHLLGFDHQTDAEEAIMNTETEALVAVVSQARSRR